MSLNTTPRTWVTGEVVTAAMMNTEVRDALTGVQAAWSTYTPAWTATTTNPTLGNGTIAGRFLRQGKMIEFTIALAVGSTTAVGTGQYIFSLPVTALGVARSAAGTAVFFDTSAATEFTRVTVQNGTTGVLLNDNGGTRQGAAVPVVPATGDLWSISGTYEAA